MFCRQMRTKCLTAPWSCEPARVDLFTHTAFISLSAPCVYEAGFLLEDVQCTFGCRHCCTLCTARGKERERPCRVDCIFEHTAALGLACKVDNQPR